MKSWSSSYFPWAAAFKRVRLFSSYPNLVQLPRNNDSKMRKTYQVVPVLFKRDSYFRVRVKNAPTSCIHDSWVQLWSGKGSCYCPSPAQESHGPPLQFNNSVSLPPSLLKVKQLQNFVPCFFIRPWTRTQTGPVPREARRVTEFKLCTEMPVCSPVKQKG